MGQKFKFLKIRNKTKKGRKQKARKLRRVTCSGKTTVRNCFFTASAAVQVRADSRLEGVC